MEWPKDTSPTSASSTPTIRYVPPSNRPTAGLDSGSGSRGRADSLHPGRHQAEWFSYSVAEDAVEHAERFDGKLVLLTNIVDLGTLHTGSPNI